MIEQYNDQALERGRDLLRELLPTARRSVEQLKDAFLGNKFSPMASASMDYLTEDNLDAIVIYEGKSGHWFVDLVLKWTPVGIGDVFSTPQNKPFYSYEAAQAQALERLIWALISMKRHRTALGSGENQVRIFALRDFYFRLPGDFVDGIAALPGWREEFQSAELVHHLLDEHMNLIAPEGLTDGIIDKLSEDHRNRLLMLMAVGMLFGVLRHPESETP